MLPSHPRWNLTVRGPGRLTSFERDHVSGFHWALLFLGNALQNAGDDHRVTSSVSIARSLGFFWVAAPSMSHCGT